MEQGMSRRGTIQLLVVAAAAAAAALNLFSKWRRSKKYDGLEGLVSFSSRIIAAMRAVESEQEGALFKDPLARAVAGQTAIGRIEEWDFLICKFVKVVWFWLLQKKASPLPEKAQQATGRKYPVGRIVPRTVWFDQQLLAALNHDTQPRPLLVRLAAQGAGVQLSLQCNATPRQVVLLGAGMDTRAWRLELPAGVKWFEVDKSDVLGAKRKVLTEAGASFQADAAGSGKKLYPLKAASYAELQADLSARGWTDSLEAKGFDRTQPTVWLSEGLVMYLEESDVHTLFQEISAASAPGSVFLNMTITATCLSFMQKSLQHGGGRLEDEMVSACPDDPRQVEQSMREDGWQVTAIDTNRSINRRLSYPAAAKADYLAGSLSQDGFLYYLAATPVPKEAPRA